jgi:hypothetical protein
MRTKTPIIPAFQTALYSDAGWGVLGRVIEKLTNSSYDDALQKKLAEPLGLKHTGTIEPTADGLNALALPGSAAESSWGQYNVVTNPSGGIYSNAADLRQLGLAIANNKLLCADATREWMKPHSHTASLLMSVGAPWEIHRLALPVSAGSKRSRISDLYTKLGGQVAYSAIIALSPDHQIGFSILNAGNLATRDRTPLRNLVGQTFLPAAEAAGHENAAKVYAGTFVDPSDETTNITLTVDDDKPAIGIESLFLQGADVRGYLASIPAVEPADILSYRLYYSGNEYVAAYGGLRKLFNAATSSVKPTWTDVQGGNEGLLFEEQCTNWEEVGFWPTTAFELEVKDGKLQSVIAQGVVMKRVE